MIEMALFEIAVIENPTESARKDGALEKIIIPPKLVVSANEQSAGFDMLLDNAEKLQKVDKARMQVIVRPFR